MSILNISSMNKWIPSIDLEVFHMSLFPSAWYLVGPQAAYDNHTGALCRLCPYHREGSYHGCWPTTPFWVHRMPQSELYPATAEVPRETTWLENPRLEISPVNLLQSLRFLPLLLITLDASKYTSESQSKSWERSWCASAWSHRASFERNRLSPGALG